MGLTHHWKRPTELSPTAFKSAADDCRKALKDVPDLAGFDGTGEPKFTDEHIVFNGRGDLACEPFEVASVQFHRHGRPEFYSHCKTLHSRYDLYVKAALIIVSRHLSPQLIVTSDSPEADWSDAKQFVQERLGYGRDFKLARDPTV